MIAPGLVLASYADDLTLMAIAVSVTAFDVFYGMLFLAALAPLSVVLVLIVGHDRRMGQAGSEVAQR